MAPEEFLLVQPQQVRALEKFRRMIETGREILAESGLAGLTSDAVVARAGVNISTFYKYFPNREALIGYLAVAFIEQQTEALRKVISTFPPDAPMEQVIPAMIDAAVDDWSSNPASRALQSMFMLDPVLYEEYSRSAIDVAEALRPFMQVWGMSGTIEDWELMHTIFGDCAIVLFDRAAKSDAEGQARVIWELKRLAIAYLGTGVRTESEIL